MKLLDLHDVKLTTEDVGKIPRIVGHTLLVFKYGFKGGSRHKCEDIDECKERIVSMQRIQMQKHMGKL